MTLLLPDFSIALGKTWSVYMLSVSCYFTGTPQTISKDLIDMFSNRIFWGCLTKSFLKSFFAQNSFWVQNELFHLVKQLI